MVADLSQVQIVALTMASVTGVATALYIAHRIGRFLNFRTLVLLNYVLVSSVSGIAHLANDTAGKAGYYDIRGLDSINAAIASTCIGLFALCSALLHRLPSKPAGVKQPRTTFSLRRSERQLLLLLIVVLLPLTVGSTIIIQSYAAELDSNRIVAVDGGMARYSYAAKWFTWATSFAAIWLVSTRWGRNRLFTMTVAVVSVLAIVGSLAWSGGRSIILVMTLPLILILMPRLRGTTWLLWPIGIAALANYIIALTVLRGGRVDAWSLSAWLDWQWGRFSMMGWAHQMVEKNGLMYGETFASSTATLFSGVVGLVGISSNFPDWISSTQLAGSSLRRDDTTWIVPGMNAELYLNFGLVGVAFGFYILGRVTNWIDRKYFESPSVLLRLSYAYVGSLLIFRSAPSDSGSIPTYLLYIGAPLIFSGAYSYHVNRRMHRKDKGLHKSNCELPLAQVK